MADEIKNEQNEESAYNDKKKKKEAAGEAARKKIIEKKKEKGILDSNGRKVKRISVWFTCMIIAFFVLITALNDFVFIETLQHIVYLGNESTVQGEASYLSNLIHYDEMDDEDADWLKVADSYFRPEDMLKGYRLYGILSSVYTLMIDGDKLVYGAGRWYFPENAHTCGTVVSEDELPSDIQKKIRELSVGKSLSYDTKNGSLESDQYDLLFYPIADDGGVIYGYVVCEVDTMYRDLSLVVQMFIFVGTFSFAEIGIMAVFIIILYSVIKKRIISPLKKVRKATEDFVVVSSDEKDPSKWEYNKPVLKRHDEIDVVNDSVATMAQEMSGYMQTILDETKEKQRIGTELELAAEIQMGALETKFPAFPNIKTVDIYAQMTPAKEVGGDFYDFFPVDDTHIGLVMADVSGKGVPASIYMMIAKIILRQIAMMGYSPSDTLVRLNDQISENNQNSMFVTVWFGVLDVDTGHVVAANAGHEYPILRGKNGKYEVMKDKHGMVIGAMPGMKYKEYEFDVEKGGALFLYTDGAPEATNADNELFGMDRVVESLNKNPELSAKELIEKLKKDIDEYVGDAPQFDDLTMMSIRILDTK